MTCFNITNIILSCKPGSREYNKSLSKLGKNIVYNFNKKYVESIHINDVIKFIDFDIRSFDHTQHEQIRFHYKKEIGDVYFIYKKVNADYMLNEAVLLYGEERQPFTNDEHFTFMGRVIYDLENDDYILEKYEEFYKRKINDVLKKHSLEFSEYIPIEKAKEMARERLDWYDHTYVYDRRTGVVKRLYHFTDFQLAPIEKKENSDSYKNLKDYDKENQDCYWFFKAKYSIKIPIYNKAYSENEINKELKIYNLKIAKLVNDKDLRSMLVNGSMVYAYDPNIKAIRCICPTGGKLYILEYNFKTGYLGQCLHEYNGQNCFMLFTTEKITEGNNMNEDKKLTEYEDIMASLMKSFNDGFAELRNAKEKLKDAQKDLERVKIALEEKTQSVKMISEQLDSTKQAIVGTGKAVKKELKSIHDSNRKTLLEQTLTLIETMIDSHEVAQEILELFSGKCAPVLKKG